MKNHTKLSKWILSGLLGLPLPLFTYFYLVLHVSLGVPIRDMILPAAVFCALVPMFSAGAYFGTRARAQGDSRLLFLVLGLFATLCGLEFDYFEYKLARPSEASHSYGSFSFGRLWVPSEVIC
jgi:hypothetical protein